MKIENARFPSVGTTLQALVAPVVVILLIFAGVAVTVVLTGTLMQDQAEVARSQETAASALRIVARELRALVAERIRGASQNAGKSGSIAAWAADRFGVDLKDGFGTVHPVLLGADGGVLYAENDDYIGQGEAFGELLAKTRALDEVPGMVSGFISVGGMVNLAVAGPLVRSSAAPAEARGAVLVLLHPLDGELLRQIGLDFRLTNLVVASNAAVGDLQGLFLYGLSGETLGILAWEPERPGGRILASIVVPIVIAALLAGLLLSSFLRTAIRTTRAIRHGNEALVETGEALENSETKMQVIIDGVADAILSIDQQGIITSANESAREIFGYELDDLVGAHAGLVFANGTTGEYAEELRADPSATGTRYLELTARRRDGGGIIVDVAISYITYYAETVAIAIVRDVTERRRVEETLNLLSTGMILVDREGRVLMANRSASRIIQSGRGLILLDEKISASNRDQAKALRGLVENVCDGGHESGTSAVMSIDRGEELRPLSLMVAPLHMQPRVGSPSVAAIFVRDLEVRQSVSPDVLGKVFGLTPAEARVVVELVKGKSPQEVATAIGVSLNTVRNQLKQIFSKTNTGRQSELVSLVLSGTAFLSTQQSALGDASGAERLTGS